MKPPVIRITSWPKWQGRAVSEIERKRQRKGLPLHLDHISIATHFGETFLEFQSAVSHPFADSLLLRVLQFAGKNGAREGTIAVPRNLWGVRVLSTDWAAVGEGVGEKVYDALLSSGLAVIAEASAPPSAEGSAPSPAPDAARSACRTGLDRTGLEEGEATSPPPAAGFARQMEPAPAASGNGSPRKGRRDLRLPVELLLAEKGVHLSNRVPGVSTWRKFIKQKIAAGMSESEIVERIVAAPPDAAPWDAFPRSAGNGRGGNPDPALRGKYAAFSEGSR